MAFVVPGIVMDVEYRGLNTGVSKSNGNQWMTMKCESLGENTIDFEFTVDRDLQGAVYSAGLRKGDLVNVVFTARYGMSQKGNAYGYLALDRAPVIIEPDEDGVIQ